MASAAARPGAARTLLLDLDGTLAPIAPTPEAAAVPPPARATLERLIAAGWRVAIVSGRPAAEVAAMLPLAGLKIFGSHGLEGSWGEDDGPPVADARFAELAAAGRDLAAGTPGARVEHKPAGLAFHDRQVPDAQLAAWRARLDRWIEDQALDELERLDGRRVVELRPRGVHKGRVVRALALPGVRDDSVVAIGDDETDEDMFRELREHGLGVRVGTDRRDTAAAARLGGPDDVHRFLERVLALGLSAR